MKAMSARNKRLSLVAGGLLCLAVAAALVVSAFRENLVFFFSPSQVHAGDAPTGRNFRIGGMVEKGSLQREGDGMTVRFIVTDMAQRVTVKYTGILPDLFREGQGVVAQGKLEQGKLFVADQVLAKHDENYMPPEAAEAMARAQRESAQQGATLIEPATTAGMPVVPAAVPVGGVAK